MIIRGLAQKNWKAVANDVFFHDKLREEIPEVLKGHISSEFKALSSDSLLKGIAVDELASFSNKTFVYETSLVCPLWFSAMKGTVGLSPRDSKDRFKKAVNPMGLATSTLARHRNLTLSAYAYRISLILFHSGVSFYDTICLNHLGVCMSPDRILQLQKQPGNSSHSKVLIWKKSIEEMYQAVQLLQEVKFVCFSPKKVLFISICH